MRNIRVGLHRIEYGLLRARIFNGSVLIKIFYGPFALRRALRYGDNWN